jgi:hypothetical protein
VTVKPISVGHSRSLVPLWIMPAPYKCLYLLSMAGRRNLILRSVGSSRSPRVTQHPFHYVCRDPIQMFVWRGPIQIVENRAACGGRGSLPARRADTYRPKSLNCRKRRRLRRFFEVQPDLRGSPIVSPTVKSSCADHAAARSPLRHPVLRPARSDAASPVGPSPAPTGPPPRAQRRSLASRSFAHAGRSPAPVSATQPCRPVLHPLSPALRPAGGGAGGSGTWQRQAASGRQWQATAIAMRRHAAATAAGGSGSGTRQRQAAAADSVKLTTSIPYAVSYPDRTVR